MGVFLASCSDQGCIDADDFGEYESQTLEVPANGAEGHCDYNPSLTFSDRNQGSGIWSCLNTGSVSITDELSVSKSSTTGCAGFVDAKFATLCVNQCVQNCIGNSSGSSASADPGWTSTDKKVSGKNIGVTIKPGSEISMRAVGNVRLGDSITYPSFYVQADNAIPHLKDASWNNTIFDVRGGQTLNLKFSGEWNDGTSQIGAGTTALNTSATKIFNGARRLAIFVVPHPSGYQFDTSATTEKSGTKAVPLLPDTEAWTCDYDSSSVTQASCHNLDYTTIGYTNANNSAINSTFPISSAGQTSILTTYGGIIRWTGDDLIPDSDDPFNGITCDSAGNCAGADAVATDRGIILFNTTKDGKFVISNPSTTKANEISFKSLTSDANCSSPNLTLQVNVYNGTTKSDEYDYSTNRIQISNSAWSVSRIALEPGQSAIVEPDLPSYGSGGSINCSRAIAVKYAPYHDLTIRQSGFINFKIINGVSGTCSLHGRIINPSGSHVGNPAKNLTSDFYEYDDFSASSSIDPLNSVSAGTSTWSNSSNRIFVRKGQKIRFAPSSWNGTWTSSGGAKQCGIGMGMYISPRPALICRGTAANYVTNPSCVQEFSSSGTLLGCSAQAKECNIGGGSSYCPAQCTTGKVTCDSPAISITSSPVVLHRTCNKNSSWPSGCTWPSGDSPAYTATTCNSCADLMATNGSANVFVSVAGMNQCYDLERYSGKVANIPRGTGFTTSDLADSDKAKGAVLLGDFNGSYGNFNNFSDSATVESSPANIILQTRFPLTFSNPGRIKFFLIDDDLINGNSSTDSGGDFRNLESSYSDNTASSSSYTGSNGMKITLSGMLEYNNGMWLQTFLCLESSDTSVNCKTANALSSKAANQPSIVTITTPTTANATPQITSNYNFDSSGTLLRKSDSVPAAAGECTLSANGIVSQIGDDFYCHTFNYKTADELKDSTVKVSADAAIARLRVSFKILDPEVGNCDPDGSISISGGGTNEDGDGDGIAYTSNDGIKSANPLYRTPDCDTANPSDPNPANPDGYLSISGTTRSCASASGFTNQTCSSTEIPSSEVASPCKKQYFCANKYFNNSGKYTVSVRVKSIVSNNISSIIGGVISPVVEVMDGKRDDPTTEADESTIGQAERIYIALITDPRYKLILNICLVMMVTFYGLGILLGLSEITHVELIMRVLKIGLIYLFVGESGWYWFQNIIVKFFKEGTDYIAFTMASAFDDSNDLQIALANQSYYDKSVLFSSVDKVFNLFFSSVVQKKISALLFASIFGWAYLIIIYNSFMLYVYSVCNAVLLYLTAQVFISILFTLGPIFFIFPLFAQTKDMFDNWLKQIIGFSLQQIFLLTTLAFFNMLMYEVIKMSLGYKICWDEVWTINIITRISLLSFWTIASLPPRTTSQSQVGNFGNPEGIPSLFSILFIWVIASLMNKFVGFMTDLAASIAGGAKASGLSGDIKAMAGKVSQLAGGGMKGLWNKTGGSIIRSIDEKLFDSGADAEKKRKQEAQENAANQQKRNALSNAADAAEKDFKKNNAFQLAGKTKEEQKQILKGVRDKAMQEKAASMGLDKTALDKLMSQKGLNYKGDNIFGAALAAGKQGLSKGGNLRGSLTEQNANASTRISLSDAKSSMKNMNAAEREKFMESALRGEVKIGKDFSGKAGRAAGNVLSLGLAPAARALSKRGQNNADEAAAEAELIREKKIPPMAKGTGWSRDDSEKKLIRERQKLIKSARKAAEGGNNSTGSLIELQREKEIQDNVQSGKASGYTREAGTFGEKLFGREKTTAGLLRTAGSKISGAFTGDNKEMMERQRMAAVGRAREELGSNEAGKESGAYLQQKIARDNLNKTRESLEALKGDKKYKEMEEQLAKSKGGSADSILNDSYYQQHSAKIRDANTAVNDAESPYSYFSKKVQVLESATGGPQRATQTSGGGYDSN